MASCNPAGPLRPSGEFGGKLDSRRRTRKGEDTQDITVGSPRGNVMRSPHRQLLSSAGEGLGNRVIKSS